MKILRLGFISFLFSSIAFILSDRVLYRLWLVPQLSTYQYIPSYDFILVIFPVALVIIVIGLMLSSWKEVCLAALVFTLTHQIYNSISVTFESSAYLLNFAPGNLHNFWLLHSLFVLCIYAAVFGIVYYSKVIFQKTSNRFSSRHMSNRGQKEKETDFSEDKNEDRTPARITYHVVPDKDGWHVKKRKAKKASSTHLKKEDALRAASDVAKSHPLSQVVVHKASGIIASDRKFGYRHYKQKKRKKEVIKKIKKGLKRSKRKENEQRLRRRKAAQLGIARLKRKQYLRRLTAKKAGRKKKNK
jgi:hypothetical protein